MEKETPTINGKQVVLREHYPMSEYHALRQGFAKLTLEMPWEQRAAVLAGFVESWEFEGDPKDVQAWGKLDVWIEIIPIEELIGQFIESRGSAAKNSGMRSTTA